MTIFAALRVRPPDLMTPAKASKPFMKDTGPLAFPPVERCSFDERRFERLDPVPDPYLNSMPSVTARCMIDLMSSCTELMKQAEHCGRSSTPTLNHPGLDSGKRAISLRAQFDGHHRLWRRVTSEEIFLTGVDQSYWLVQAGCHCGYQRFNQDFFPAKSPTDGNRFDTDLPIRHGERPGDRRTDIEQTLGARPDHQLMARGACRDGDRLGLHIGLMDRVGAIAAFDDHLSLEQTSLDITHLQRWCLTDIVRTFLCFGLRSLLRSVLAFPGHDRDLIARASQRRLWSHGSLRINDHRQRIVIDVHDGSSILSDGLRLADHDGDRMPAPHHFLLRQWRLRTRERICLGHPQCFRRKNGHDSWHSQRCRGINVRDTRVGIRTQDQARIEHSWYHLISRIPRSPGDFVWPVLARERHADPRRLPLLSRRLLHHRENSSL